MVRECCVDGIQYTGITYPHTFCVFRWVCPKGEPREIKPPMPQTPSKTVSQPYVNLPRFVPVISLGDENSWFWNQLRHDFLIVRLGEVVANNRLLKEVSERSIHEYLGFDGMIVASSIMPDEYLDTLSGDRYVQLLEAVEPDAAMTLDCYTYMDDPLAVSWTQLLKYVENARYLAEQMDIPLLAVVKGANQKQVSWCVNKLLELGYRTFVVPYRELARAGKPGKILLKYMIREALYSDSKAEVLIYGTPYVKDPFMAYLAEDPRIRFASLSWFLRAKRGMAYVKDHFESLDLNILYQCNCQFCRGRRWNELIADTKSLALHNLSQIINLHRRKQK